MMRWRTLFMVILLVSGSLPSLEAQNTDVATETRTQKLVLTKRYLNLPVQNGAPRQKMSLTVRGELVRMFEIELAVGKPDIWVFIDVNRFQGKEAVLRAEQVPVGSAGFDMIYHDDNIKDESTFYQEKLRQQLHFSSRCGWNNDPNGLVYYDGEYHLFYQHNPYGWNWGNMHWGHAVSEDLIHWKELPDALYPDEFGTMFSGSAVVDYSNTSGFQTGAEKVMVAAYTANSEEMQVQCIAYSNDRGRTWTKYEGNPIIGDRREIVGSRHIRDPKVFWHKPTNKWVMVLFEGTGNSIFTSDNLKKWKFESHISGFWECPELFSLPVDGDHGNQKWVMYGASGTYMIGDFDGKKFTMESGKHYYHKSFLYAAQTYNDVPDKRRIQIGWGRVSSPGMRFNQMMTFPSELTLRTTNEGIRLFIEPIDEIQKLHQSTYYWDNVVISGENDELLADVNADLLHIKAHFEIMTGTNFGLEVNGYRIQYDMNHNLLNDVFLSPDDTAIYLDILVDRNSIEIYANHGRLYLADTYNSVDKVKHLKVFSRDETLLKRMEIYELESIWNR